MNVDELREDLIIEQKKGLPFIIASIVIWTLIFIVTLTPFSMQTKNILALVSSAPLMPVSYLAGKKLGVNITAVKNPLGNLAFLFTMNQMIYLLIVVWVFNAVPEKMIMVYAMVFGGHLLPYSWIYKSKAYKIFSIFIPIFSLIVGNISTQSILALSLVFIEIVFTYALFREMKDYE